MLIKLTKTIVKIIIKNRYTENKKKYKGNNKIKKKKTMNKFFLNNIRYIRNKSVCKILSTK